MADSGPCPHYSRSYKILAPCCGRWYVCRFCHDEGEWDNAPDPRKSHKIDRTKIETIRCNTCHQEQTFSDKCRNCEQSFGEYSCDKCKFNYSYEKDRYDEIFHCDKCGLCRVGKASEWIHCDTCNACLQGTSHTCIPDSLNNDCPVCLESMRNSTLMATKLPCGHFIHAACLFESRRQGDIRCPSCKRTTFTDEEKLLLWAHIDSIVAQIPPIPEHLNEVTVTILCNDCNTQNDIPFMVEFLKCPDCGGYNTNQQSVNNFPEDLIPEEENT